MRARTVVAATAAALVPALGVAEAQAPRYVGQAIGNSAQGEVAKTSFPVGASYALRFTDSQGSRTRYRLCGYFNGERRGRCTVGRTSRTPGKPSNRYSIRLFLPQRPGRLEWRWTVGGKKAASVKLRITAGD